MAFEAMASCQVTAILEYKNFNNTDYVYVRWDDCTTSWERISNLSCKELIFAFLQNIVNMIKESEKMKEEELQRKKEENLLQKMLNRNLDESAKLMKTQAEVLNALASSANQSTPSGEFKKMPVAPKWHAGFDFPMDNSSRSGVILKQPNKKPISEYSQGHSIQNHSLPDLDYPRPSAKRKEIARVKYNIITINMGDLPSVNIKFFYRDDFASLTFESNDLTFVSHDRIEPYLFSLYTSMRNGFQIFTSVNLQDMPETALEAEMRFREVSMVCRSSSNTFWIISTRTGLGNFIDSQLKSRFTIFKIDESSYFDRLFQFKGIIQQDTLWVEGSFKSGVSALTDEIGKNISLPSSKRIYMFGDSRSTLMVHLHKIIERNGAVVETILDADTVLIEKPYVHFLHFLTGFYTSLRKLTKFFIVKPDGLQEIFPAGGMITFTDEFIEKTELLEVANLLKKLSVKRNWELKIKPTTYTTLKHRLGLQTTASEHIGSVKMIYKEFKNCIYDYHGDDFRAHLEKMHFKTHRYFLEVSTVKIDNMIVTIDEASKLVMTS